MHHGEAFRNIGGKIEIIATGYYSIIAQLHNKHGNSKKWIRTNIKVNDDVKSRR